MDSPKQEASQRIKQANNILVTVSSSPSVDQLSALLGLTVSLNKMGKHATAVFSGEVPSTLEFLQPEKTIEKNTDSLRDFIIALDKSKADKLRYKVEDRVVKIFITPYRTSISAKDLEFSQGDFNVDVVLAVGVHSQAELDHAITSHGRILHDATIITLNTKLGGELGSINWVEPAASSLSEIAVEMINELDKTLIDGQIATALLTGIISETDRFSNNKTTPQTMSISAQLMSNGANQQLVSTKLQEPIAPVTPTNAPIAMQDAEAQETAQKTVSKKKSADGTLEIVHDETKRAEEEAGLQEQNKENLSSERPEIQPKKTEETPLEASDDSQVAPKADSLSETADTSEEKAPDEEVQDEPAAAPPAPQIHIDDQGSLVTEEDLLPPLKPKKAPEISHHNEPPKMIVEPPLADDELAASGMPTEYHPGEDTGLPGIPASEKLNPQHNQENTAPVGPTILPPSDATYEKNAPGTSFLGDQPLLEPDEQAVPPADMQTLADLEDKLHVHHKDDKKTDEPATNAIPIIAPGQSTVSSDVILPPLSDSTNNTSTTDATPLPPTEVTPPPAEHDPELSLANARDAVLAAMNNGQSDQPLPPIQALNAAPGLEVNHNLTSDAAVAATPAMPQLPVQPWTPPIDAATPASDKRQKTPSAQQDENAPPAVPPPMMPLLPSA